MKQFTKILSLEGTAARARLEKDLNRNVTYLILNIGKSHEEKIFIPETISVEVFFDTKIKISGNDLILVSTFTDIVKNKKKPNLYSGSGIIYFNEIIKKKKGKKK